MRNKFKRFNTVLIKLAASYVLIGALSVLLVGVIESTIYKSYFNKQIEASNNIILDNLKDFVDKDILEKADTLYLNIISNNDDLHGYLDFCSGDTTDYIKIKDISKNLAAKQVLNADWCMNLYIYEAKSDTLIGTNGIINSKVEAKDQKPSWFNNLVEIRKGYSYLPTVSLDSVFSYSKQNGCILVRELPLRDSESHVAYLFCEIREDLFANVMRKTAGEDSMLLIVNQEGSVISSTETVQYPYNVSNQEYFKKIAEDGSSHGFFKCRINNAESVVSYSSIERYNWTVINIKPTSEFYRASQIIGFIMLGVCLITIILVLLISNLFARSIYKPMRTIIKKLRGDNRKIVEENEYEIINNAFMNMSGTITNLEETIENNKPLIKNNIVQSLIYHKLHTQEELDELLNIIEKKIGGKYYTAIIMKLNEEVLKKLSIGNSSVVVYNIISDIENSDDTSYMAAQLDADSIVLIGARETDERADLIKEMRYFEDYFASNYYISCIMIIGSVVNTPLELYKSFGCAAAALKYKFLMPKMSIVFGEDISSREDCGATMPESYMAEFKKCLNIGSVSGCKKAAHVIIDELINGEYKASYCNTKMMELVSVISLYMKEKHIKSVDLLDKKATEVFDEISDVYELREWLDCLIERVMEYSESKMKENSAAIVENVKAYITENLSSDLSLNLVAEKVFLSPQYLSKVFKEHIGMNFSAYVTDIRMEKAAELLLSENISIEAIAGMVGYNTPHYFIKKFKEKYGVTPKIYRTNNL